MILPRSNLLLVVGLSWMGALDAQAEAPHEAQITRAREVFKLFLDKEFEAFHAACDERVRAGLSVEQLGHIHGGLLDSHGQYERELKAEASVVGPYISVDLLSKFKTGTLNVRVTLDKQNRVAGFHFLPGSETEKYAPPDYADPANFREEVLTVTCGEFELPGTLTLPTGGGPFPAVVLVHGSGPHDQDETLVDNKPFKDIAWGLASRGVAVLRYEKRTHKYGSTMDPRTITIDEETVDDALAAARLLMKRPDIDGAKVFVAGHSLGATAAPYLATKESQLGGIILLAAAARPIYELVVEQIPYIARLDGTIDEKEKAQIEEINVAVAKLRDGTWKPGDTLLGAPAEYWSTLDVLQPVERLRSLDMPVLIVQGGRDYQVSPERDFGLFKRELGQRDNVTFKLFDMMDHLFRPGDGPSTPDDYKTPGHVGEEVVDYLAQWVKASKAR